MRLALLLFFGIVTSGFVTAGYAQSLDERAERNDFYVGGSVGGAYFSGIEGAEYDLGFAVSGFFGYRIRSAWRLEFDLSYEEAEFQNSADATSIFRLGSSLHADFDTVRGWVPYLGGGIGVATIDVGNDEDNVELSGHLDGGFAFALGDGLDLVPGIRIGYFLLEDIDDQVVTQLRAGLRWHP